MQSALRLCNAALERIPSDHITALKAVALVKQGKHAEAHQVRGGAGPRGMWRLLALFALPHSRTVHGPP